MKLYELRELLNTIGKEHDECEVTYDDGVMAVSQIEIIKDEIDDSNKINLLGEYA